MPEFLSSTEVDSIALNECKKISRELIKENQSRVKTKSGIYRRKRKRNLTNTNLKNEKT